MNAPPSVDQLRALYLDACALDVQSVKPGNVSLASPGHGMCADDFLRSAQCSAAAITRPQSTLGRRVYDAIAMTQQCVGCNTNLGIVLLAAPLLQACIEHPDMALPEALRRVLAASSVDDTEQIYSAIRLAAPAGLGETDENDVAGSAKLPLTSVMCQAAGYDLIARQYANGFTQLFQVIEPYFDRARQGVGDDASALTDTYLYLLTRYPDSHIQRKHGLPVACQVQRMAQETRRGFLAAAEPTIAARRLVELDHALKAKGLNPGTSADLCVAAVISNRLQRQAANETGPGPGNLRTRAPTWAGSPLSRQAS